MDSALCSGRGPALLDQRRICRLNGRGPRDGHRPARDEALRRAWDGIDEPHSMGEGLRGNPAGRLRGSRNRLSEEVICALLRDFREHGQKAIAEVRRKQPGVYLKVVALLIPREHKLEHSNSLKELA